MTTWDKYINGNGIAGPGEDAFQTVGDITAFDTITGVNGLDISSLDGYIISGEGILTVNVEISNIEAQIGGDAGLTDKVLVEVYGLFGDPFDYFGYSEDIYISTGLTVGGVDHTTFSFTTDTPLVSGKSYAITVVWRYGNINYSLGMNAVSSFSRFWTQFVKTKEIST